MDSAKDLEINQSNDNDDDILNSSATTINATNASNVNNLTQEKQQVQQHERSKNSSTSSLQSPFSATSTSSTGISAYFSMDLDDVIPIPTDGHGQESDSLEFKLSKINHLNEHNCHEHDTENECGRKEEEENGDYDDNEEEEEEEDIFHEASEPSIPILTSIESESTTINNNTIDTNTATDTNNQDDGVLLLTLVQTDSDAPIVLYHPDQNLDDVGDIQGEIIQDDNNISNHDIDDDDEVEGRTMDNLEKVEHLNHNDVNHENKHGTFPLKHEEVDDDNDTSTNNDLKVHSQIPKPTFERTSSALDNLMKAAVRPTFEKMVSYTKVDDDLDNLVHLRIDDSTATTARRNVHDLEMKGYGYNYYDKEQSINSEMNDYDDSSSQCSSSPQKVSFDVTNAEDSTNNNIIQDEQHVKHHSSSHGAACSSSSVSSSSITSWSRKINTLTNKDTGKTYDLRDLTVVRSDDDNDILEVKYFLFPSKDDLLKIQSKRKVELNNEEGFEIDDDENDNQSFSPFRGTRERLSKSRMAVSATTNRVVAKASKTISKSFLRRTKSDTEALSSTITAKYDGQLLEPFPDRRLPTVTEVLDDKKCAKSVEPDSKATANKLKFSIQSTKAYQQSVKRKPTKVSTVVAPPKNSLPVKCINKSRANSDFHPMLLLTTFAKVHDGPILRSSFSKDGRYLATAGSDGVLNIWQIGPTREELKDLNIKEWFHKGDERWRGEWDESNDNIDEHKTLPLPTYRSDADAIGTEITLISPHPIQSFKEHTRDIVDISWSNTGYLLSASLDKSVRLWHPTRPMSLHQFNHPEEVTSVSFHPTEDRYFLSGGFDKKLRIWQIPDGGRVVQWSHVPHIITTASYQPDGKRVAAGLVDGTVIFYSLDGVNLKFFTEIVCKNRNRKVGKKVTGLAYKNLHDLSDDKVDDGGKADKPKKRKTKLKKAAKYVKSLATSIRKKKATEQVLITSNDSRLRLVGLNDFCMVRKYKGKGHLNISMMLKARFSESGDFIIVGSETGKCAIWNTATGRNPLNVNVTGMSMYDKVKAFEYFEASTASLPIVTEAQFAPSRSTKNAFLNSGLFPSLTSLDHIHHDFSSAMIVTCDYDGTIRVFLRRSSFEAVVYAAGPAGYLDGSVGK